MQKILLLMRQTCKQSFLKRTINLKALESYALSFYVDELLQSLLVYENSKIVNQINSRNRTEKCIAIYYELYQKEKKTTFQKMLFATRKIKIGRFKKII